MVDILETFPGRPIVFKSMSRQEQSRLAGGIVITKNLGDPIWYGEWQSREIRPNAASYWKAILEDLELTQATFDGYDMYRRRPILHPLRTGAAAVPGPITLNAVGGDNTSFTMTGAAGLNLSIGDMVQVGAADLYRAKSASVDGASVQVMPQLWPGTDPGDAIVVLKAKCLMAVLPDTISVAAGLNGMHTVSFRAIEARDA